MSKESNDWTMSPGWSAPSISYEQCLYIYTAYKSLKQKTSHKQKRGHFHDCYHANLLLEDSEDTVGLFTVMKKWSEIGSERLDHIKAHLIRSRQLCDESGEMTTCTGLRWPRQSLLPKHNLPPNRARDLRWLWYRSGWILRGKWATSEDVNTSSLQCCDYFFHFCLWCSGRFLALCCWNLESDWSGGRTRNAFLLLP